MGGNSSCGRLGGSSGKVVRVEGGGFVCWSGVMVEGIVGGRVLMGARRGVCCERGWEVRGDPFWGRGEFSGLGEVLGGRVVVIRVGEMGCVWNGGR